MPGAAGEAGSSRFAGFFEDDHGVELLNGVSKPCNFASLCSNEAG